MRSKSFAWQDCCDLLVRAHLRLGAPIVVVRDNPSTHRAAGMRKYAAGHDWLTVTQLPSYSSELSPVEGVWSLLRPGPMANTAFTDPDHLTRTSVVEALPTSGVVPNSSTVASAKPD
ncbi:transposase [Streptomyces anandii]|uniref:Transposase n=1 Tax=Streptomyces anandii TaxID=285454 RepID=A0ABW6HET7_9ACTN